MLDFELTQQSESSILFEHPNVIEQWDHLVIDPPPFEEIKALRESLGITQKQAAFISGVVDRAQWAKYENGNRNPSKFTWTVFLLATKQHPTFDVEVKK